MMDINEVLHILRNPHGWCEDEIRTARLAAADETERLRAEVQRLKDDRDSWADQCSQRVADWEESQHRLTESQAREQSLLDDITDLRKIASTLGWARTVSVIDELLAQPRDHSALDTLLDKARAEDRGQISVLKSLLSEADAVLATIEDDDGGDMLGALRERIGKAASLPADDQQMELM